jgi:hypothetical protein
MIAPLMLATLLGAVADDDSDPTRGRSEVGAGLGLIASPIVGAPNIFLTGPALTASARIGGSLFLAFDLELAPLTGLSSAEAVSVNCSGLPVGRGAGGAGWRLDISDSLSATLELSAFLGMGASRDGDTGGLAFAIGLAPSTTFVWRISDSVGIALRGHVGWTPLTTDHPGEKYYLTSGIALEPTFIW